MSVHYMVSWRELFGFFGASLTSAIRLAVLRVKTFFSVWVALFYLQGTTNVLPPGGSRTVKPVVPPFFPPPSFQADRNMKMPPIGLRKPISGLGNNQTLVRAQELLSFSFKYHTVFLTGYIFIVSILMFAMSNVCGFLCQVEITVVQSSNIYINIYLCACVALRFTVIFVVVMGKYQTQSADCFSSVCSNP